MNLLDYWGSCRLPGRGSMSKLAAIVQIVVILTLVGFSTYGLFKGDFSAMASVIPLLLIYYVFVTARRKRP